MDIPNLHCTKTVSLPDKPWFELKTGIHLANSALAFCGFELKTGIHLANSALAFCGFEPKTGIHLANSIQNLLFTSEDDRLKAGQTREGVLSSEKSELSNDQKLVLL